jgi:hypothetical protein
MGLMVRGDSSSGNCLQTGSLVTDTAGESRTVLNEAIVKGKGCFGENKNNVTVCNLRSKE